MRLVSFTIENFRSITKAYKIHLYPWTVLIGPNNEGKSNILRALVIGMQVLTSARSLTHVGGRIVSAGFSYGGFYDWQTDFPVQKQKKLPNSESTLLFEFELTQDEITDFHAQIKSELNGTLPIRIALGPQQCKVSVAKKGRGAKALTQKSSLISHFIMERLDYRYIPTVRNAEAATTIVTRMLDRELEAVEKDPAYKSALDQIAALQQPILDQLSTSIKTTLVEFLPKIKDVRVIIASKARVRALRRSEILVNDGTQTRLEFKGDGVQSLAAIALMRHASERSASGRNVIIAIEEPESHLHPIAIHALRSVLAEVAKRQQVVITTHCPLFIDRTNIGANIIVNKNKARVAKSAQEMRAILGVRASDNLLHAELVLLVEGEEDRQALSALLPITSAVLKDAWTNGVIAIDTLGGGSNVAYKASQLRDTLCACHCFLDYDKAGRDGFAKAKNAGLLTDADVNFTTCEGMPDSELEDLYDIGLYKDVIFNAFRVTLDSPKFRSNRKWSERMRDTFKQQGKDWTDSLAMEVKRRVADLVVANPASALNAHKRNAYDALSAALEQRIRELHSGE